MIALASLALWSIIAICPLAPARALVLNLYNVTSPGSASQDSKQPTVGVDADTHCTNDPNWLAPAFPTIARYEITCQAALFKARRDLASYGLDTEYELLDRDATAQTTRPQIRLPRKYVASEYRNIAQSHEPMYWVSPIHGSANEDSASGTSGSRLPSCTVALAMINSLEAGEPLPGQPPGPFGSSDVMTMRELLYSPSIIAKPFTQCLRFLGSVPQDPLLGWTQAGQWYPSLIP